MLPHSPPDRLQKPKYFLTRPPAFSLFKWNYASHLGVCLTEHQRFGFEALALAGITDKKGNLAGEKRKERWEEMEKPSVKCYTISWLGCCISVWLMNPWRLSDIIEACLRPPPLPFFSHSQSAIHRPSLPSTIVSLSSQRRQASQARRQVTIHGKHNS